MSDFETVPVGTMEELKRVKEDRDALKREVSNRKGACCVLEQGYKRISEERDALAAHVERMSDIIRRVHRRGVDVPQWLNAHLVAWQQDKPATSLTCLKAEWQAHLMEQARRVRNYSNRHDVFEAIPVAALEGELRHQAEESRDD